VDINIINGEAQGSNHVRLVTDIWWPNSGPDWSPAGDIIAYIGQGLKNSPDALWLANGDGTGTPPKLYTADSNDRIAQTAWNPDGTELAFIESGPAPSGSGTEYAIRVYDLNTDTITTVHGPTTDYSIGRGFDWSRDGTKLAFIVYPPPAGGTSDSLYTLDIATDTLEYVDGCQDDGGATMDVAWSPDDSQLAYVSTGSGGQGKRNLLSIDLSTGDSTMLIRNSALSPDWRRPSENWPA
jgi:Tol biopolymer transport system component